MTGNNLADIEEWICPACDSKTNNQGKVFANSRAVALHIAGNMRVSNRKHINWAIGKIAEKYSDDPWQSAISVLAHEIEPLVKEENEKRLKLESKKVERLLRERESKEPRILAFRYIEEIETKLHKYVRISLRESFGDREVEWWVSGVPLNTRIACTTRREEDGLKEESYNYTDLIDLKTIIDKNWRIFDTGLPRIKHYCKSKKEFLNNIAICNEIRKKVMHPVRMLITENDVEFLAKMSNIVGLFVSSQYQQIK